MDGGLLGGIPLNWSTTIRLVVVVVLAVVVRQAIVRFQHQAMENWRDKSGKPQR